MSLSDERDTPELFARRLSVQAQVHTMLGRLLAAKRHVIGEVAYQRISAIAACDIHRLGGVAQLPVNATAGLVDKTARNLGRDVFWSMDEAISALADSVKGRWQYMGVLQRNNSLTNALASIGDVERLLRDEAHASPVDHAQTDDRGGDLGSQRPSNRG